MTRMPRKRSVRPTGSAGPRRATAIGVLVADRARDPAAHRAQGVCPGQRIPTCEAIAAEFGANKNTASKAYRSLAKRGYLLTPGRRRARSSATVRSRWRWTPRSTASPGSWRLAVQEAKLSGLQQVQFRRLVDEVISHGVRTYRPAHRLHRVQPPRRHDAQPRLAARHRASGRAAAHRRRAGRARALPHRLRHSRRQHHPSVGRRVGVRDPRRHDGGMPQTCSASTSPSIRDSLMQVARLRPGTRVGIVCDLKQTLVSLKGLVDGYNAALRSTAASPGTRPHCASWSMRATCCSSRHRPRAG